MLYFFQFVIALVFPFMITGLGLAGGFGVFLGLSLYCLIYLCVEMKETKGKTKAEICPMYDKNRKKEK